MDERVIIGGGPKKVRVTVLTDDVAVASSLEEGRRIFVGKAELQGRGYARNWVFKGQPRAEIGRVEVQKESVSTDIYRNPQVVWRKK